MLQPPYLKVETKARNSNGPPPSPRPTFFSFLEGLMTLQEGLELGSLPGDSLGALTSDLAGLQARGSGATLG